MTTVTQCLTRAMRMNSIKGEGEAMNASEAADALVVFNETLRGLFGLHIGGPLESALAETLTAEPGVSYEGGVSAATITLPDLPQDGWRVGFSDAGSFATHNLTIDPNDRKIGGSTSNLVLNTLGDNRTYFYRADTGNWEKERDLTLTDDIYLPAEMIGPLTFIMARAIATEYGGGLSPLVVAGAANGVGRLRARYGKRGVTASDSYY